MKLLKPKTPNTHTQSAPLFTSEVSCGLFGIAEDFIDSYLSLDEKFLCHKESVFLVRASGDSMQPNIVQGDILIVDRALPAKHQSILTVFYNGQPLCKQLIIKQQQQFLHSFNENYVDLEITEDDEFEVFGVVIGMARDFLK